MFLDYNFFFVGRIKRPKFYVMKLSKALAENRVDIIKVEKTIKRSANPLTSETRVMKSYTERDLIVISSESLILKSMKLFAVLSFYND